MKVGMIALPMILKILLTNLIFSIMDKKVWKTIIDIVIMALTAIGGYLGASAANSGLI